MILFICLFIYLFIHLFVNFDRFVFQPSVSNCWNTWGFYFESQVATADQFLSCLEMFEVESSSWFQASFCDWCWMKLVSKQTHTGAAASWRSARSSLCWKVWLTLTIFIPLVETNRNYSFTDRLIHYLLDLNFFLSYQLWLLTAFLIVFNMKHHVSSWNLINCKSTNKMQIYNI